MDNPGKEQTNAGTEHTGRGAGKGAQSVCVLFQEKCRLYQTAWPEFDEEKTVEAVAEIAVQINGKMRGTIKIAKDADKETAIAAAKEAVADKLTGNIVKEIYVPGRIVNIVQK